MFFWIFMMIMDLLMPLIMLGVGKSFRKNAPKEINYIYGYRTTMSMKNKETWEFANKMMGEIWYKAGKIMLIITLVVMIPVIGRSEQVVSMVGGAVCIAQLVPILASIIPIERALRRNFDKNGNRKKADGQ